MRSPSQPSTEHGAQPAYALAVWNGRLRISAQFALFLLCPAAHNRKAWLFCGSELAGQRAAVVMSLVMSAKLNGHDPWAYLKEVLTRLPTHLNSRIEELLPHRWTPAN
jgi:transposase